MPNVSWEDIGGLENVKRELQEVKLTASTSLGQNMIRLVTYANLVRLGYKY